MDPRSIRRSFQCFLFLSFVCFDRPVQNLYNFEISSSYNDPVSDVKKTVPVTDKGENGLVT